MSSKGKKSIDGPKSSSEEITISSMKKELELEQKAKDTMEWSNAELERSVRAMEANVMQLESGNFDADDSEIKQKYENQRQLNVQLQEQKRWLEHELEQVRLKIQNEKQYPMPDPFSLDWDNLSETELKRLVGQLEKTRNDLKSDLRERQWRLDKEGKEYHHYDDFCRMYTAEIKNLNRILESLMRTGMVPTSMSGRFREKAGFALAQPIPPKRNEYSGWCSKQQEPSAEERISKPSRRSNTRTKCETVAQDCGKKTFGENAAPDKGYRH
ncbi:hypothetical protein TCAL_15105 [Tigriopus californicus]|uniref:Uncharacterized protein n=1 Tax=Tigriopus californicus TaxID=6832 RepID=A0A553NTH2_TIGCA|nr:hypothetical protein TCAL_15105 [Tigriopus californicus]